MTLAISWPSSCQAFDAGVDQALAQLVQHQGAADQDGQAQQVEDDDQPPEARPSGQPLRRRAERRLGRGRSRAACQDSR